MIYILSFFMKDIKMYFKRVIENMESLKLYLNHVFFLKYYDRELKIFVKCIIIRVG